MGLNGEMTTAELAAWLRETDPEKLGELYERADRTRREAVGDEVWLRGLVEVSNVCRRNCLYCGVRAARQVPRYRMTRDEILECARKASEWRFGTLVLQAGEDLTLDANFVADLIAEIKKRFHLAITLSLGERDEDDYRIWKNAGADRYLLRFETSNRALFDAIHPPVAPTKKCDRVVLLESLRELGYEIGSGVMIGIPGQTYDDLARDLDLFRRLDLDMIGCGPFLTHPDTPLGRATIQDGRWVSPKDARGYSFNYPASEEQVPAGNESAFKVVALTRILLPNANIPSTTAIATLDASQGRKSGLSRGANVVMPNLTPGKYRAMYEIYPNKSGSFEEAEETRANALRQIAEIGRVPGEGAGSSPRFQERRRNAR